MHHSHVDHQALFEHIYSNAPIGIALVSVEGTYKKVNPALCGLLGYSEEQLTDLSFRDITYPEDLNKDEIHLLKLRDGSMNRYETEKRYVRKDGSMVWVSLHTSVIGDNKEGIPFYFISHMADISDRKAAEQDLLKTQALYNLIADNALDIISYSAPDGTILYTTSSVREVLGYEPDAFIGTKSSSYCHPDDIGMLREQARQPELHVFTYRVRHKAGHYIWMETTIKKIRNEEDQVIQILGIGRDITERKKQEERFAESQRIASLGDWEWDMAGSRITLSDQIYSMLEIERGQTPNPSELIRLLHPEDRQQLLESIKRIIAGSDMSLELRYVKSDQSIRYLLSRGSVVFDEQGIPVRLHGTIQDITERKNVEFRLQETIERYTSLKKYNHDAVISLGLDGNIINSNAVAEQLTGYPVKELMGRSISEFIGVSNMQRILENAEDWEAAETPINTLRHRTGQLAEVLVSIAPIIISEATVGYYIIAKDITEQKRLLIAKEAAEKTNQAKSEFLAMMSHEIRTPMNGVIGMTDLLLATTELDEQQKEYVEIISKSGNTLLTLINDILDFSKIESGKAELQEELFSVRECIAEASDVLFSKAMEKNLEMTVSVSPDIPILFIGDSNRLRQVLLNLIGNAIKFTYTGRIAVSVEVGSVHQGTWKLIFRIQDTGIGIPKDKLDHLFQPFYQLAHFMTRKAEGTGLGLAISKKLVEMMGGEIWVEPMEGPGATFVFTARFLAENQELAALESAPAQEVKTTPKQPINILIAEDNEINQQVLLRMLKKFGYEAKVVCNGNEVLQAVAYESFDLVFMDVQMPIMNGLEATRVLKETIPAHRCPRIVGVTANALVGDREMCLEAGMDDYISKPISSKAVAAILERWV